MSGQSVINPNDPPTYEDLAKARDQIEQKYAGKGGNVHTVYIGEVMKQGIPTGEIGIVVHVDDKKPRAQLAPTEVLPEAVRLHGGNVIPVDVQQEPQPTDLRLKMSDACFSAQNDAQAGISDWRNCNPCPLKGGVQIAPEGAGWVGTLSGACTFIDADGKRVVGAFTNYHVAVSSGQRGHKIGHPSGSSPSWWFGVLDRYHPISFSGSASNKVDAAVINTWREDGLFAPGCHTVIPEQLNLGKINPSPVRISDQKIGDAVHKSGRTTGYQKGKVVGIGASTHISYDQGTARFTDQIIIRGDSGDFSGPGDSGSLVLTLDDNRPFGLLFAGGGGTTIINPIEFVQEAFGMEFFGM